MYEPLSTSDRIAANEGLRLFSLSIGEKNLLADWFGVGVRTVERWFADAGQQYRPCIPVAAVDTSTVSMYDGDNYSGVGSAKRGIYNNMRYRVILAGGLGTDGLVRENEQEERQTGTWVQRYGTLRDAIKHLDDVFSERLDKFMAASWYQLYIVPDGMDWVAVVKYIKDNDSDRINSYHGRGQFN